MRKILVAVGALAGVAVLAVGAVAALVASAFAGNAPLDPNPPYGSEVTLIHDGYVACFLVDLGQGVTVMVDACQNPDTVTAALSARGLVAADIDRVLLTHSHGDHIGGLAALPGVAVYAPAAEAPYLDGRQAHEGPLPGLAGATDSGVRLAGTLDDGAQIALGGSVIEVFHVPGHTAGSAAYLAHGVLLLGDNAAIKSGDRLVGAPWVFSADNEQNEAALRGLAARLAARPGAVTWLQPAHTGPSQGVAALASF